MGQKYQHDVTQTSIVTTDRKRPLDFAFDEFEGWLKSEWDLVRWEYLDWRETPDPYYIFAIRWENDKDWSEKQVEGLISESKYEIAWRDECPASFVLDFVRRFVARFPANGDHLCFHDGDGGFSLYEPDLTDEELYDRIVGEPYTLDEDLQKRIIASYSQEQDS